MPDHNLTTRDAAAPAAGQTAAAAPRRARRFRLVLAGIGALALGAAAMLREEIATLIPGEAPAATTTRPAEPPPALTVAVAEAAPRALARSVVGDGSVVAWQELVIGAEAGGLRVAEVPVQEGDTVAEGQLLVRLDDDLLRAARDQAEAAVAEAEATLRLARQELARAAELARTSIATRQTVEQRQATVAQAEARLAAATARREEAVARLDQARILAPAPGIVSRRSVLPGNVTVAGQEMIRLIRDGRLELDARVPELELGAIRPGQPVEVRHGERSVPAEVRAVAPTVAPETRLGTVHVALPPDSGLRPGMFARAEIRPEAATGLAVPQAALLFREGRPAVMVLQGEHVELRPVTTGHRQDGLVEVTSGLAAGERVVVAGAGFLSDGDRVRVAAGETR
ncbi:efflux RND transporter periplasmic adaptor subunit [Falsiroseomonas bella]|uniref:Efflux RND transporter periplasmic adaptor subunit n=1 Tax=Falsiroseomonas bella TaxID=2184016 RepID=A0A317FDS2_9PROT|nr:efflux RND transporter periplasmic adaptor subunit [Falsiroseomonas bella]PWS35706.1 efflux RND transporter periplasmic adaptor subunit [Falsiroseomonas bella]